MSRRASLPGADELFRRTSSERPSEPRKDAVRAPKEEKSQLQVAQPAPPADRKGPKHDEKVTFYCTREDLMALERTRLALRSDYGRSADRGKIVRAALSYMLEDFEARGEDSLLLRKLAE
ncbi:MAG: hypothetical protein M3198_04380 [Actinomycetota bacterium]|nr:hypothetical protein [Actinomycetota bacterium]